MRTIEEELPAPAVIARVRWRALGAVLAFYGILICAQVTLGVRSSEGRFIYPLDDTYIHMSMARNLVESGTWGTSPEGFTSSSSSPTWTLILAASFYLTGINVFAPLVVNILLGAALIVCLFHMLAPFAKPGFVGAYLALIVVAAPLPTLVTSGMEHVLHILLMVLLLDHGLRLLSTPRPSGKECRYVLAFGVAATATRYESLALVGLFSVLLLQKRLYLHAFTLPLAAVLPLVAYGIYSVAQGWYALPNSILLKGTSPSLDSLGSLLESMGGRSLRALFKNFHLVVLITLAFIGFFKTYRRAQPSAIGDSTSSALFIYCTLIHLQFADTGWLYRYEAYLVTFGLLACFPILVALARDATRRVLPLRPIDLHGSAMPLLAALVLISPLGLRAAKAFLDGSRAMNDRYLEHIQPAEFVRDFYAGETIVVNDLGTFAFFSDCRVLDMFGLGSLEPLLYRKEIGDRVYTKEDVLEWTTNAGAEIAILQVKWGQVFPRIPDEWRRVAEMHVPRNVVFRDTTVGFFALGGTESASRLEAHLIEFAARMPPEIDLVFM